VCFYIFQIAIKSFYFEKKNKKEKGGEKKKRKKKRRKRLSELSWQSIPSTPGGKKGEIQGGRQGEESEGFFLWEIPQGVQVETQEGEKRKNQGKGEKKLELSGPRDSST